MSESFEVFDKNAQFYGDMSNDFIDSYFIEYMLANPHGDTCLDIGGASGRFAKAVRCRFPGYKITIVDPSNTLLNAIDIPGVEKIHGYLPNKLNVHRKFDYISVNDVFHHVCGETQAESKKMVRRSLKEIHEVLEPEGVFFLHELFYESYIVESITRSLIFRALSLQNRLQLRIPAKEFLLDLKVNFYSRAEIETLLKECGYRIVQYHETKWKEPRMKKHLLFLKEWGDVFYVLKKNNDGPPPSSLVSP